MPIGKIATFDEGSINGSIEYSTLLKSTKVSSENRELLYTFYAEKKPVKAYIVIITETRDLTTKWRLWLNNFSLTKEFKPIDIVRVGGSYYNLNIYDVTHLTREGKNEFVVSHSSIEGIWVHIINSVLFYEVPEFKTNYKLRAGIYLIQPSEEIELDGEGKNYVVVRNPNKSILRVVNSTGTVTTIGGSLDSDEIEVKGHLSIIHESSQRSPAFLFLHYSENSITPNISINVNGKIGKDNKAVITLYNDGEVDLDRVLLNAMLNGVTIHFKSFDNIKIGQKINYEFFVPKKGNVHLRIVGVKSGFRKILDKDLEWETA
ncbi:hypothetical protein [Acidianus ambivalens]|uniref:Uncharacterized protein n=1 Tax=Acidianus ambivalens TaxID=2283 RepID=A0A650CSA2_ACIAM|nr:hypothetical protein [Acidianus ambivalens]MQL55152.1 hypothetical protein [Acidianus ambivalens]QGR20700.1 hypothetical protein D1866_00685 [Acidianus ambivalens]